MSVKSLDKEGRWRDIIIGFRVSEEESERINQLAALSGMTKQVPIIDWLEGNEIAALATTRVQMTLAIQAKRVADELARAAAGSPANARLMDVSKRHPRRSQANERLGHDHRWLRRRADPRGYGAIGYEQDYDARRNEARRRLGEEKTRETQEKREGNVQEGSEMIPRKLTGNAFVDAIATMAVTDNVIPVTWYKTIATASGGADLAAINILSDVLYWYRPSEIRDESTGDVVAYRKRFSADLLQRGYDQLLIRF